MIPFSDYQLLREMAERFPGSVQITQGEVIFNDDYVNEAWYNPMSWGQQQPTTPFGPQTQQIVAPSYAQKAGQIDTITNPGFKADVKMLRDLTGKLQTPKLQGMMKQWMGKIFTPMPGMSQQTVGANVPGPANAQDTQQAGAVNQPQMSQADTGMAGGNQQMPPDMFTPVNAMQGIPMPQLQRKAAMWKA